MSSKSLSDQDFRQLVGLARIVKRTQLDSVKASRLVTFLVSNSSSAFAHLAPLVIRSAPSRDESTAQTTSRPSVQTDPQSKAAIERVWAQVE